jgi:hypothetical protein
MGGTNKSGDSSKIGHFGTGLKYTLAFLLRNKMEFAIVIDKRRVSITTESETIGKTNYDIICINGQRTSITTQMGTDWMPWMIVREIYSNALDEGGASYGIVDEVSEDSGTNFYLELTPDILQVYNDWGKYFLIGKEPIYQTKDVKIYPSSGKLLIYKQGVLIHEGAKNSLFNYDILNASINELREYKGFLEGDLIRVLFGLNNPKTIQYFIEHLNEEHHEAGLDYAYSWSIQFNPAWNEAVGGCKVIHTKAKEQLEARGVNIDETATIVVPEKLYQGLTLRFDGIGALRVSKAVNEFYEIYNDKLHDKTRKAEKLLEQAGYYMEPELTFKYGVFGDKTVMARVCLDTKVIYISEKHIDTDLFSICTMLVEENEHFKTGLNDETRAFQQHFINLYTNSILEKDKVDVLN